MIFVPFGRSPPPHSLVTKSTGTSSEQIISKGQHIAAQAAGKAPKFTLWANNPLPIARSGDSTVVPTGLILPGTGGAGRKPVLACSQGSGTPVPPRQRPPSAPCPSPDAHIPGRDAPAAKSALMPNASRSHVPRDPPRVLLSGPCPAVLGDEQPWASGTGRENVGLGAIPPGEPRTSGNPPSPSPAPQAPRRGAPHPKAGSGTPRQGRGVPGPARLRGRGLRGRDHPGWPLMGRAPPRRAAGGLTWGERRLWGGSGSRAGRRGPTGRRAVKEASRPPGAGAALCVPKLRDPPARPRSP